MGLWLVCQTNRIQTLNWKQVIKTIFTWHTHVSKFSYFNAQKQMRLPLLESRKLNKICHILIINSEWQTWPIYLLRTAMSHVCISWNQWYARCNRQVLNIIYKSERYLPVYTTLHEHQVSLNISQIEHTIFQSGSIRILQQSNQVKANISPFYCISLGKL